MKKQQPCQNELPKKYEIIERFEGNYNKMNISKNHFNRKR